MTQLLLCLQGRFQMSFLPFLRLPPSYWKTKWMFFALLESATVLLEDSVSKGDSNWIFYSSVDYHRLTGRPNDFSLLFWRAPPSYWKILFPREIPTEFSTLLEITTVLLEDQMNVLSSSGKHHPFTGRLCLQDRSQTEFSTLLEITKVLLEHQLNDLWSSGKHHRLTGRFYHCLQ